MKKLVLFFAAAVAVSFASCGSTTTTAPEVEGEEAVIEATVDTTAVDEVVVVEKEVAVEAPVVAE